MLGMRTLIYDLNEFTINWIICLLIKKKINLDKPIILYEVTKPVLSNSNEVNNI